MVYLINPAAPKLIQVANSVRKEFAEDSYRYLIIGGLYPNVAEDFVFPGLQTVFVHYPEAEAISEQELAELTNHNIIYLRGEHNLKQMFHSASQKFRTLFPTEIMASTISSIEASIQKCIEISVTAVDRNIIKSGERIIAVSGEEDEPDTAIILEPSTSAKIIDTKIIKIICHPYHEEW